MRNIEAIKQKKGTLVKDSRSITDNADKENRNLTTEERSKLDKLLADIDETNQDIIREERLQAAEMGRNHDTAPVIEDRKKEKRLAFFKYVRQGKQALNPEERALVEDTTGGYLIPEDIEAEIYRVLPQLNFMRQICTVRQTNRDKVRKRSLTEVSVGWGKLETGTIITESTPTPSTDYIYAEDLYGLTKIGEDELMDNDDILAGIIANSFAVAIANAEASAFAIGTGHTYSQPDGIAVDTTLLGSIGSGAGAGATGTYGNNWTTDDTVVTADILECEYSLPAQYLPGAAWLMHRKTEAAIRDLRAGGYTASDGPYLWQPSLLVGQPRQFDGFPVYNNNAMKYPADTTAGTNIIFGNFKLGYVIVDRLGITMQRLNELYAEDGLIGFKAHSRVGGGIVRRDAFQLISNDT